MTSTADRTPGSERLPPAGRCQRRDPADVRLIGCGRKCGAENRRHPVPACQSRLSATFRTNRRLAGRRLSGKEIEAAEVARQHARQHRLPFEPRIEAHHPSPPRWECPQYSSRHAARSRSVSPAHCIRPQLGCQRVPSQHTQHTQKRRSSGQPTTWRPHQMSQRGCHGLSCPPVLRAGAPARPPCRAQCKPLRMFAPLGKTPGKNTKVL